MSESHLPDDLARWPDDPFAVLGVKRGVGPRELRKAYTALIRVFKPEHRPDHFRRIREAFETVQRYAVFFLPEPEAGPARLPQPAEPDGSDGSAIPTAPRVVPVSLDDLWDRAVRGEVAEAYRALVAELDRGPPRAEVFARLYWLAAVAPEVDPDRPAAEWLVRGMAATGLSGVLLELYGSDLHENPVEAADARASDLLKGDHPPGELAAFARVRWQALARAGLWDAIHDDYDRVHEALRREDEADWLWLVSDLVTWIAWDRRNGAATALARTARQDVRSLEHLALRHGGHFDRLDLLEAVARSCQRLREVDSAMTGLTTVLRDSWLLPPELLRRPLENVLADISAEPVRWVERFDRAGPEALAALSHFGNLLNQYRSDLGLDAECPHPPALLRTLATAAVRQREPDRALFRARALRFCLDEAVDPGIIRAAFHPNLGGPPELPGWVVTMAEDGPLQCVCWACRVFRA